MKMHKIPLYQQLLLNTIPLLGYWFWDWSMFAIIYLYFMEALVYSFFLALRVWLAKGPELNTGLARPGIKRFFSGIKLMFGRTVILGFYWIFVFFFVAMGEGKISADESMENMKIIAMVNPGFNMAILAFVLAQTIELYRIFILGGEMETKPSTSYLLLFDKNIIVLHIVIVLGTFASTFLYRFSEVDRRLPGLGFVLVLFFIKSLMDFVLYRKRFLKVDLSNAE